MKILITGGFGYLGSHIAKYLSDNGLDISINGIKDHPEFGDWCNKFDIRIADISDKHQVNNATKNIDIVLHCAALNNMDCEKDFLRSLAINVHGTNNLLEDAAQNNVKLFIYISTFHIYDNLIKGRISESALPSPFSNYALTHYYAEMLCNKYFQQKKLPTLILRLSNGYGAPLFDSINCWDLVFNDLCRQAFVRKEITLKTNGEQERDFIAISDILRAISLFINNQQLLSAENNTFNVGTGKSMTIKDLAETISRVYEEDYGKPVKIVMGSTKDRTNSFTYSIERIKLLGFKPIANIDLEVRRMFEFLDGNNG